MPAILDPDILTATEAAAATIEEERDLLIARIFHAERALAHLNRGLLQLYPAHPAFGPFALCRDELVFCLSDLDTETMHAQHPRTAVDPITEAVAAAVAAVPRPCFGSLFDEADADDLQHGYDAWRRQRIAAARRALDELEQTQ